MSLSLVHQPEIPACPFLPLPERPLGPATTRSLGKDRGPAFYEAALNYGHSLWLRGLPARGILLLNRAMGCDLTGEEEIVQRWPMPYEAMVWILQSRKIEDFIGNPRRHWQHLATRMVEPRKELRTARAWACWYLSRLVLPDYPADELQIEREGVTEPSVEKIESWIELMGLPGELDVWQRSILLTK
ncbi:MAG: hypothetical protein ACI8XO_005165 [Verrucomicrobiales bacterium]|jgi:hypothetical protein